MTAIKRRCDNCEYWMDHEDDDEEQSRRVGTCRRFPPVHLGLPELDERPMVLEWSQPVTSAHWRCGEWLHVLRAE